MFKKNISISLAIIFFFNMTLTSCSPSNTKSMSTSTRGLASVSSSSANAYPKTFLKWLKNQKQEVSSYSTLKEFSTYLPKPIFNSLQTQLQKTKNHNFNIERENNLLLITKGSEKLVFEFFGPTSNIIFKFENINYDVNNDASLTSFLRLIEGRINSSKSSNILNKKSSISNAHIEFNQNSKSSILSLCFDLLKLQISKAQASNDWLILGGMALIAIAIAVSANKLGKNLKKTEHTVNVNHTVGLSKKTDDAINDLADSVKDIQLPSNVDVFGAPIETTTLDEQTPTTDQTVE